MVVMQISSLVGHFVGQAGQTYGIAGMRALPDFASGFCIFS
jgi:hypothetical protein